MRKATIRKLYIIAICVGIIGIIAIAAVANDFYDAILRGGYNPNAADNWNAQWINRRIIIDSVIMSIGGLLWLLGSILFAIAWINVLINLSRAQFWGWFALTFFFGGIMVLIYLVSGPEPFLQVATPQPLSAVFAPNVGTKPALTPALDILQQRYARGEIDTATFNQMRDHLIT